MANTTENLIVNSIGKEGREVHLPVAASTHIYEGTFIAQSTGAGTAVPGSTASSGQAVAVSTHEVDNSAGIAGAKRVACETDRVFEFANGAGGDACSEATDLFAQLYMIDDHTVADNDGGASRQKAGLFMGMSENGKVRVYVGMRP